MKIKLTAICSKEIELPLYLDNSVLKNELDYAIDKQVRIFQDDCIGQNMESISIIKGSEFPDIKLIKVIRSKK